MPIRSVRISNDLWQRLERATNIVNRHRRRRISMSSVIRALLEQGLAETGDALAFDGKIVRPARVVRSQKAKHDAWQAEQEAVDLFKEVSKTVNLLQLTPLEFAASVGGNRRDLGKFYHSGALPEGGDAVVFVARIREWLVAQHQTPEIQV